MNGIELIAAERERQMGEKGWTPLHDDGHGDHQLASAGGAYALWAADELAAYEFWPWPDGSWKPGDSSHEGRIRTLAKAGALIAAEIDRLQRMAAP